MTEIALRVFTPQNPKKEAFKPELTGRVFVFDTETTIDEYQNLKIGSFAVYENGTLDFNGLGLFYNPDCLKERELTVLKRYHSKYGIPIYTLEEFVDKIFYPEVYYRKALCIGFNLPFDLSRLAKSFSPARRKMKGGFSFRLSKNKKYPQLRIKSVHSKLAFIRFGSGLDASGKPYNFNGNFLDLHTLTFSLTNENHSLKSACKEFKTERQKMDSEHGIVTEQYVDYNINDTLATHQLYGKLKEEYEKYNIDLAITQIYSPASIGKACLKKLAIKPFLYQNPVFSKDILGKVITTYYGGRSEVKIRHQPTKVVLMDFLSMYPTVCTLQGLWKFVIADRIRYVDDTENTKQFVENVTIMDIQNKDFWKSLTAIVEIEPDNDILPVRCRYSQKNAFNIGINYVSSEKPIWYTLSDVIASKLLTGKSPKIRRVIRFEPVDIQTSLESNEIASLKVNPIQDDLFKLLIEKRQETDDKSKKQILKIIANATSYGIFIEIVTETKKHTTKVYGLDAFETELDKLESSGQYYNPLIAVFITSAARLILATVERILSEHGTTHAFCDTDSMAVPKEYHKEIQDFFKPLNPYKFDNPLFKIEPENLDSHGQLKDLWFYGISAKRYVLYNIDNTAITIRKHSSHGLGHITNPFGEQVEWEKKFWLDILSEHYGMSKSKIYGKLYSNLYAVCKICVSTSAILRRFSRFNKNKTLRKQIKPFNFVLVGIGNKLNEDGNDTVKPITAFRKDPQEAVHDSFIDYNTGKTLKGLEYWKPMDIVYKEYREHPEAKFEGKTGILQRKHIVVDKILYIGKESTNIESVGVLSKPDYTKYNDSDVLTDKLLHLTPKEAKSLGIARNTLWHMKRRAKIGKLKLSKKIILRLSKSRGRIYGQTSEVSAMQPN